MADSLEIGRSENVIGTFLYAASVKNYEACRLIFTSDKIVIASIGWKSKSAMTGIIDILSFLLTFPLTAPSINTNTLLMQQWSEIKNHNKDKSIINYDVAVAEEILNLGTFGKVLHGIASLPYSKIKTVSLRNNPMTNDYRLTIRMGLFRSAAFLIPESSLNDLKELIEKTPINNKLSDTAS